MKKLKNILKKTFIYPIVLNYRRRVENKQMLQQWKFNGNPSPPPQAYKHFVIKEYATKYGTNVFIETGTFMGDTIESCKSTFKKLISIELDQKLYEAAKDRFKKHKHISIYHGDSGEVIEKVLTDVLEPCLFWLDGHYSEGATAKGKLNTPIIDELKHIMNQGVDGHVILIDDARCFTGGDDYPTIEFLRIYVKERNEKWNFSIDFDIIRIHQ